MAKADDWWQCLKHLFTAPSGTALGTIGNTLSVTVSDDGLNGWLLKLGLALHDLPGADDDDDERRCLVVPAMSEPVARLFEGTRFDNGGYWEALRTAPGSIVIRDRGGTRFPIGNQSMICMFVDLAAWEAWCASHLMEAGDEEGYGKIVRSYIKRLTNLAEEKQAIADLEKDVMKEATGRGLSAKALRRTLALLKLPPDERMALEADVQLYLTAMEADGGDDEDEP